ncbi:TRAP-type C4-dicarboxylate transport system permease small subunit [Tamaricihabitans halophyticus]|uniref:TRAP-type C4-dicarboxylate transport system permease small subunit n=1 Tax=Tamaricihabitans halophyticus TaxID=1262583 RepID=A0A4R2QUB1_9PSEU|nr:TRAP transporter small permease [Tamaricihabitans halophyticus]TCP53550.1 TRAP-type C4-dicarboxylate transport system permease small subunit [Tamaricihabitans halophyticus]
MANRILSGIENTLAALPFAVVAAVAFVNVISRYFFNASLAFTTEITVNLVAWTVMMGAVIGIREGAHLGFSALYDRMRGTTRLVMTVLSTAAVLAFLAVLLVFGIELAAEQAQRGRGTPAIDVPQWLFTIALPVGALLGAHRAIQACHAQLRGLRGAGPAAQEGAGS